MNGPHPSPLGGALWAIVLLALFTLPAQLYAQENVWLGANADGGNSSTDINDGANWSLGHVPTTGETAVFNFAGVASQTDLFIDAGDTDFNPSAITFHANQNPNGTTQASDLYIDKNLNLTGGLITTGNVGSGNRRAERLRIGTLVQGITLVMGGNLDITDPGNAGDQSPAWEHFILGVGDANPGSSTTIEFTNSNVLFASPVNDGNGVMRVTGANAVNTENATYDLGPQMRFTNVGGAIHLESAGSRTTGAIGLGNVHLDVRSDQTWTADDTAFVQMYGSVGSPGLPGKFVVESIDGGRLDNLGELNIKIHARPENASAVTAMRMQGGTYGSLGMYDLDTSGRVQRINQVGDVNYVGGVVEFDVASNPYVTDYSMFLSNRVGNSDGQEYSTAGFDLDLAKGLYIEDLGPSVTNNIRALVLLIEGSDVTIGGDVRILTSEARSPEAVAASFLAQNNAGIDGGATGANLKVGGDWDVRTNSRNSQNLSASTLTMTGGLPGDAVTFEVADASTLMAVGSNSWSIATFNIGESGNAAHLRLVNDYINDNPVTGDAAADKVGEKLLVGELSIDEDSVLDANGQFVQIGAGSLDIHETGWLDLNTGEVFMVGDIVETFMGVGDQTATWDLFASRVMDSSNLDYQFGSVLDGGNTYWQVTAIIPEPGAASLILLAVLGVAGMRRRQGWA